MKKEIFNMTKNMMLKGFMVMVTFAITLTSFTACTEDEVTGEDHAYVEGVTLPAETARNVSADGGRISVAFTTKAGFNITYDNKDMIKSVKVANLSEASKGGNHSVSIEVNPNTSESDRSATIYITVDGFVRTELIKIKQSSKAQDMDNITTWLDERLKTEYYWLDEYNDKWATFDFKVERKNSTGYNAMLAKNLGKMTTNMADGGIESDGSRYIYSNVSLVSTDDMTSSTRSSESAVYGYGFDIMPALILLSEENGVRLFAFSVNHVYAQSPAAASGLRRSDLITKVNNTDIIERNVNEVYTQLMLQQDASITLEKMDFNTEELATITLSRAEYEPNPVAYSAILEPKESINPSGKKIGYLSYLSFDYNFDTELIDAMKNLADKGAEEFVLDLRSNGGGAVPSAVILTSMILDESYVGQVCAKLVRNPKNKYGNDVLPIQKYADSSSSVDLPNLNMQRVFVLVSDFTASASEMVITALEGLDIDVVTIGLTTEGKNCGMDVLSKTIGKYECTFAPITFLNFNAKDFNDYADGLTPDVDFEKYIDDATVSHLKDHLQWYPLPRAPWGNTDYDIALAEAVKRINDDTLFKPKQDNTGEGDQEGGDESGDETTTRSVRRALKKSDIQLNDELVSWKRKGLYLTEQGRLNFEQANQE